MTTEPGRTAGEPAPSREQQRPAARPRVLRRSRDDRLLGGICGGIGRYLGIDPVLIRGGVRHPRPGPRHRDPRLLIAWLVIPEERPGDPVGPHPPEGGLPGQVVIGLVLISVGVVMLARVVLPDVFAPRFVLPAVLILGGILVLVQATRRR